MNLHHKAREMRQAARSLRELGAGIAEANDAPLARVRDLHAAAMLLELGADVLELVGKSLPPADVEALGELAGGGVEVAGGVEGTPPEAP